MQLVFLDGVVPRLLLLLAVARVLLQLLLLFCTITRPRKPKQQKVCLRRRARRKPKTEALDLGSWISFWPKVSTKTQKFDVDGQDGGRLKRMKDVASIS